MIPDRLLSDLRDHLAHRRISQGIELLAARQALIEKLGPAQPNAAALLGYVAQWIDIGFATPALLRSLVSRFPRGARGALPLADYIQLRMAEGLLANYSENNPGAIQHFEVALAVASDIPDQGSVAIAHFWIARCLRKLGRYDDAYRAVQAAVALAERSGFAKMAAVMRLLESWICFQKGRNADALAILAAVEHELAPTDDFIVIGNIHSARGRITQREGKYEQALDNFRCAIESYQRRDPGHPSLARALANMAFVERLCAQQLRRKIDRDVRLRRPATDRAEATARLEQFQSSAFRHLDQSQEIFRQRELRRGEGNVYTIRGGLHLDRGELDRAQEEAERGFRLGQERQDSIVMARARVLQCIVENTKLEEGFADDSPDARARRAFDFAREAVEHAGRTENIRLLARARIWEGLTLCNDYFAEAVRARECCDDAARLIKTTGQDYLWEDLQILRARLAGEGSVDARLREWSQGQVQNRTFQELAEEFAEIVIPKVWEREQRKVSRVAKRLSISPKKVRRILTSRGLLQPGAPEDQDGA